VNTKIACSTLMLLLGSLSLGAELGSPPYSLSFPVEKNHIKVFAQRFEYQLIDKDRFQIGDILIDTSKIDFQLVPVQNKNHLLQLRFRWPAGLVNDGEFVVKDNVGKALFTQKMHPSQIQLSEEISTVDSGGHGQLAIFETPALDPDLIQKLQYSAFFKLCINKGDRDTRIFLCSKDLFLKKNNNDFEILSRDSFRKDSYVEINGKAVDPQGIIYLNETTDTISMRALMVSGATIEVATHRKDVHFSDMVVSDSGEQLLIRTKGTEPVSEKNIKRYGPEDWEIALSTERPTMYIKGEGGIPLRQEFLPQGKLRSHSLQIGVGHGWEEATYSSEVSLELVPPPIKIRLSSPDKYSFLQNGKSWYLKDLKSNTTNVRYLNVDTSEGNFIAAYEIYRGTAFEASTKLFFPLFSESDLQWWLNGFRWGLSAHYDKILAKGSSTPDWSNLELAAHFRFTKGLHMKDPTMGMGLTYGMANSNSTISLLGLDFFSELKTTGFINAYFDWWLSRVRLPLMASGGDNLKNKMSYDLEFSLRNQSKFNFFYEIGLRLFSYALSTDVADTTFSGTMIFAGIGSQF
jgi:hypothetical protein